MTQHGDFLAGKIAFQQQGQRLIEPLRLAVILKSASGFRPKGFGKMFPRNAKPFCQRRCRQRFIERILNFALEIPDLPAFPGQVETSFRLLT